MISVSSVRRFSITILLLSALLCPAMEAQSGPRHAPPQRRRNEPQRRSLLGTVWRKGSHQALALAVVYLKNDKTLEVRTFITKADGRYRFDSLSINTDYEAFAIYNGKRSDTKTLSSFDRRSEAYVDLKIDAPASVPSNAPAVPASPK